MGSMYQRRGILTNLIAVVLAFTMPLCCCIIRTATSATDSCCAVEVVETTSCCQEQSPEQESENDPCCNDCGCTIKGTIFTQNWTPPIDLFGVDAPTHFFVLNDVLGVDKCVAHAIHGPPKYNPHILGFSGAPPMRGSLILEV